MNVHFDKFTYSIDPVSCPLKEHSIANYIFRSQKKERKGRRKASNDGNNNDQPVLVKITPLELGKSAKNSYSSYQSALAAATETILDEYNLNNDHPSIDNLILSFSHLKFFDPCTQTFKKPENTTIAHIEFIFENTDFFSQRYKIQDNIIYRKSDA